MKDEMRKRMPQECAYDSQEEYTDARLLWLWDRVKKLERKLELATNPSCSGETAKHYVEDISKTGRE